MRKFLSLALTLAIPAAAPAEPADTCLQRWIAAYSIAWSHQVDAVGRMFWVEVAGPDALKSPDARKVWLALRPLDADQLAALADAAYAVPREAGRARQQAAAKAFADASAAHC